MRAFRGVFVVVAGAAQAIALAVSFYQTAILVAGWLRTRRPAAAALAPAPEPGAPPVADLPRFGLFVCARNEAPILARIVGDMRAQEYPSDRFEVVVVAHNCHDGTAAMARSLGARVVEVESQLPGKAYAIVGGLDATRGEYDFAGIFDADSRLPPDLLAEVARAAAHDDFLQVETVPEETGKPLAAGYGFGRRARNLFIWRPRAALGFGSTINGSGFFARAGLLAEMLRDLHTLTEDLELTARVYASGRRVAFVSSTRVQVQEPQTFDASLKQRLRWVRGHVGVLIRHERKLIGRALRGDLRAADVALYLAVPTRLLTRLAVSGSMVLALLRLPGRLPLMLVVPAFAGEWFLPAAIAVRERLIPLTPAGIAVAVRHSVLGLLWFPIGFWAIVTASKKEWAPTPRAGSEVTHVVSTR